MFKKLTAVMIIIMFSIVTLSVALASEGPDGNKRKGKYTYRKVYKACAEAGGIESATPKISPADKKKAEWKDIFENKTFDEFGCTDYWSGLSDKDILDIYSYFFNYAADSPTPATCK
ncbi:MAG: cytochrome c family protein [Desulfobacteraceae bacterium]|nr:cytochrome c family protein [Desulfobacteraceae bacterium]